MSVWTCQECQCENRAEDTICEYCSAPKQRSSAPKHQPPKPLPLHISEQPPEAQALWVETFRFLATLQIGSLGEKSRLENWQREMRRKYPQVAG